MPFLPIVEREARVDSRAPGTYWSRSVMVLMALAVMLVIFALNENSPSHRIGLYMFHGLSWVLLFFALLAGCFLTADCIGSERRNGTLGLLFLTPLKGRDIVLGKLAITSLQAFYGFLAILPLLFLPLLMGGITLDQVLRVVLTVLISLMLSLSLGMLVSTCVYDATRATMITLIILCVMSLLPVLYILVFGEWLRLEVLLGPPLASPGVLMFLALFGGSAGMAGVLNYFWAGILIQGALIPIFLLSAIARVHPGSASVEVAAPKRAALSGPAYGNARRPGSQKVATYDNPFIWLARSNSTIPVSVMGFRGLLWLVFVISLLGIYAGWFDHDEEAGFVVAMICSAILHATTKTTYCLEIIRKVRDRLNTGEMEILLAAPATEREIVNGLEKGFHSNYRRVFSRDLISNLLLVLVMFTAFDALYMDDVWPVFLVWFVGGGLVSLVDSRFLNRFSFRMALTRHSFLRSISTVLGLGLFLPWCVFALVFFTCIQMRDEETALAVGAFIHFAVLVLLETRQGLSLQTGLLKNFRRWASGDTLNRDVAG